MAKARILRPVAFDIGEVEEVVVTEPALSVVRFTDGSFVRFEGKFDYSSEAALDASPVTAIAFSGDFEGTDRSFEVSEIRASFGAFLGDAGLDETVFSGKDQIKGSEGDEDLFGLAGAGSDLVDGGGGDDVVEAGAGRDKLFGGDGKDLLISHLDPDTLTGGGDGDLFLLGGGGSGTKITDFSRAEGDRLALDFEELFENADPEADDPNLFIELRGNAKKVTLFIDADGGGDEFVKWATIKGDLGTDLDQLIADKIFGVL